MVRGNYIAILTKMMIAAICLTGCANDNREAGEEKRDQERAVQEKGSETGSQESAKSPKEESNPSSAILEEAEGSFIGMIDSTSAEVEVNGETRVFRLSENVNEKSRHLEEGAVIHFSYSTGENGEQVIEEVQLRNE